MKPETRDAYYETEAVIDHYLWNKNTPPFVAKNLIQHFGISNPSPAYIEAVANAFAQGVYEADGVDFGDGKWGDMTATVAAILLDREATSVVLDADPAHGGLREPMVKIISLMRSMEYTRTDWARNAYPVLRRYMVDVLGQAPYEVRTVLASIASVSRQ